MRAWDLILFFQSGYKIFPAQFAEDAISLQCVFFASISLIYMSFWVPVTCCLHHIMTVVEPPIKYDNCCSIVLFPLGSFDCLGYFMCLYEFCGCFQFGVCKHWHLNFVGYGTDSSDCFC